MDKNVKNTMLISPNSVKASTYLVSNVDDGVLGAAIRETQEVHLQSIIGSELLYRMQELEGFLDLQVLILLKEKPRTIETYTR